MNLCSLPLIFTFAVFSLTDSEGGRIVTITAEESEDDGSSCPKIIARADWNATPPTSVQPLSENPPPYVVVHHSATGGCNDEKSCARLVKSIQNFHMNSNGWEDIGYNFVIGGDGSIFEGRGWGIKGAHAISYNSRSIGICLLGNFMQVNPSIAQENALKKLIGCGAQQDNIEKEYHLIGHREVSATLCPGDYLYQIIKKWSHFDGHPTK